MNILKKITVFTLAIAFALSGSTLALAESSVSANTSFELQTGNVRGGPKNVLQASSSARMNIPGSDKSLEKKDDRLNPLRLNGNVRASSTVSADSMTKLKERADKEIDNRINSLTKLQTRLNGMTKLSSAVKASLSSSIDASISELRNLKAKIDADTDAATLKTDVASITASYRIYMLVMPKVEIAAAADRINTIVDMMTTIGDKFQARIKAVGLLGKDVTAIQAALNDYTAKIADAKVQAQAAITLSSSLTVDNGDKTKAEANRKALADARAKLKAGRDDLQKAREDANKILRGLKAFGVKADLQVSATSTLDDKLNESVGDSR